MQSILVIDDDDEVRSVLAIMLDRAGYEVQTARDGNEGIEKYRAHPSDLVITDIVMPEKEGIETITELRRDFPDAKIIAMSGGGKLLAGTYLDMARAFGVSHTFTKPVSQEELLSAVHECIG